MAFMDEYNVWLTSGVLTEPELEELRAISGDEKEIESRFFDRLEFGTAGLRAETGLGPYRMNVYVVRHTTQAICELIKAEPGSNKSAAICFDCRINSDSFAREAARVFAGNGINVRIFESLRPTPELSFVIREYGCTAGINITASHNPKEYNGYKVYWSDGAQLPPQMASVVTEKMAQLDLFGSIRAMDYNEAVKSGLITVMGAETDELFLRNVLKQATDFESVKAVSDSFEMVFTPFHGAGHRLVPEALHRLGIKNVHCVPEQMVIDGTFPTVTTPNPESEEGFALAVELAKKKGAHLIIGTDPDADRVGVMAPAEPGVYSHFSGNQIGALLVDYIIGAKKRAGTMPNNPIVLKTIVTTELARRIAERNGVRCIDTFTGFKYMAEKKNELESCGEGSVIFAYEESFGYMTGDFVRDKDAVTASVLITEMAAWYHAQGLTLFGALKRLYEKYGWYGEQTLSINMPGLDGMARMRKLMNGLRILPPKEIAGAAVLLRRDYLSGYETDAATGNMTLMELTGANVLNFQTEDGTVIVVRPSGTEPKVKVYLMTSGGSSAVCAKKLGRYAAWAEAISR